MKKTKSPLSGALGLLLTLSALTPFAGGAAPGATSVVVWGEQSINRPVPDGITNAVQVTTGVRHCAALRSDGTVITWGVFDFTAPDEIVIPQPIDLSNVVAIASGKNHVLALKSDGTVVRWGVLNSLRPLMPVGLSNVVAISGGFDHSLALKADGTVVAWQTMENVSVPANLSNVIHIAATAEGGMALRQDGAIVSFEKNFTETNQFTGVPIKKIATQLGPIGFLRVDGTITIPFPDATFSPVTNLFGAKDLDVGANTMLALRSDGTLVGFGGSPNGGELPIPTLISNNVLGVSIYERSAIALLGDPVVAQPPQIIQGPTNQTVMASSSAVFTVSATGTPPLSYQWRKAGVPLAGQTASVLAISNVTVTAAGNYDVVVSGAGSVTSAPPAALTVLAPPIITSPAEVKGIAGVSLNYQITAIGNPTGFQAPGLPAGLTFNPSTGLISGAPAAGGQTDVTLVATNLYGAGFQTLTVKVRPVGTVVAWGSNIYGESTVPADLTNVVTVSAGQFKSLALLNTGNVAEWGDQPAIPPGLGNVTAISGGFTHFLALRSDGTVVGGGGNAFGESTPPVGLTNVVSVTAGDQHSVALRQDGSVVAWGRGDFGQTNVPANLTNVIAIDAGGLYRTLALKADGTVVQWGSTSGIVIPPNLSNLVAIAAGDYHSLALRQDGTVVGWGSNDAGQTNIPVGLTNVVAIAAGSGHSLALKANGTVVAWGTNSYGQFPIPAALTNGSNVVLAIAARNGHSLAVVPNAAPEPPTITLPPQSQTVPAGGTPYLFVSAAGTPTLRYQWFKAGVPVGGATNALFGLPNIQPSQAGGYYVVVTNAYGAVTSSVATLTVNAPGTLLSQNFEGGTDLNLYQSLTAPTTAQFNSISGTAGAGALVMDIASQAGLGTSLVLSRPGAGSVSVVRTTDLAASVGAVMVQMRFTPGQIKATRTSVLTFQLGTNFSVLSQAEFGTQVAAQIAVDLRGLDTAGGQWGWTGSPITFNGFASNAFPLVTWAVNNSGGPISYTSPDGGSITLADGKFDLWVGDSSIAIKVFDGAANLNAGVPLRNFKLACNDGNASYGLDEFTITKVAAEAQPTLLFNTTPRSASTTNGGTVTLSALNTGTGSLSYQWFRNGNMVSGATDSQLLLTNFSQYQDGFYSLKVTGPAGSITSAPSAVVVTLPPSTNLFAGTDGFDGIIRNTTNWGDFDFVDSPFYTRLIQEDGRLVFSQNTPGYGDVFRMWKQGLAPGNQDWEARVQVELPFLPFAANGYVGIGLAVLNAADPGDRLNLDIEVGKDNGVAYRAFYATHTKDDQDQQAEDFSFPATNTVVLLRARWISASGLLLMEYDADGPANGENWVTLRSFYPGTNWGTGSSNSFILAAGAYAEGRTVSPSDAVILDSFSASTSSPAEIAWLPTSSTRDGVPFTGLGTVMLAPPGATNPIGLGQLSGGTYRFGFFNQIPANPAAPTPAEANLTGSPITNGTKLVLKFSKRTNDHVSFVAMTADASVLLDVGYAVNTAGTEITVRAKVVNPVVSQSNNPDTVDAAFGLLIQLAPTPTGPENFRGTVFVTDMLYHDVEPPGPGEAAQTSTNYIGQMVSLAAKGISASTATFHAFIPERLFAAGRANGVDVTGENCLGYRTYLQLTGSSDGFFKLNSPTTSAFTDANFDSDGDGSADAIWRYKIANSTWSRQVIGFGKADSSGHGQGSLVGSWHGGPLGQSQSYTVLTFQENGEYFLVQDGSSIADPSGRDGMEHGTYSWNPSTGAFSYVVQSDTDGGWGFSHATITNVSLFGNTLTLSEGANVYNLTRVTNATNPLIGGWRLGTVLEGTVLVTFLNNGEFFLADDGNPALDPSGQKGMERGTYTWNSVTGSFSYSMLANTDGQWGFSDAAITNLAVTADSLLIRSATEGSYTATRIGGAQPVPPSITVQPASAVVVPAGSNALLSVSASGTGLGYLWLKGALPLAGATAGSLSLTNVNRASAGNYLVVVTNAAGSVTSSVSVLRVLVPQRLQAPERLGDGRLRLRFGDQDGGLAGADDLGAFEVYATTNVFNTNSWVRLTNGLGVVNGQVQIEDAGAPGLPRRFYRIIER